MFIPFLIAGLVLPLTSGWFAQQHLVGDILLWVCAALFVIQIVMIGGFVKLWRSF